MENFPNETGQQVDKKNEREAKLKKLFNIFYTKKNL